MSAVKRSKIFIKNLSAIDEKRGNIFAVVAEVGKKRNGAAKVLPVLNIDVRTTVNAQVVCEFHL